VREQGELPQLNYCGGQVVHPAPPKFFSNLHLNVSLLRLLQTPLYAVYTFFNKIPIAKSYISRWLSWLFFTSLCCPNRKIIPAPVAVVSKYLCIYIAHWITRPLINIVINWAFILTCKWRVFETAECKLNMTDVSIVSVLSGSISVTLWTDYIVSLTG